MKSSLPQSVDANASGPVLPQAWDAYVAASAEFADPQANHAAGHAARACLEQARAEVAQFLGAQPDEIHFTSGGTEADAMALGGVLARPPGAHCVSSTIEHAAVTRTLEQLTKRAQVQVSWVPVDRHGCVQAAAMANAMHAHTRLVTLVAASNETGVLQPVREVAAAAHASGAWMHTDAVQVIGKIPVNVQAWDIDLLALAGHKVGAVAGIGALYVRRGVALHTPYPMGAANNVAGAASLAAALKHQPDASALRRVQSWRDDFESQIVAQLADVEVIGSSSPRLGHTSCLRLGGCEADGVLMALDLQGFAVSTGSACSSGSIEPSPILLGMGLSALEARQAVRFSFHHHPASFDVQGLVQRLVSVVRRMRGLHG